jgi:hypothetical protein
MLLLNFIQIEQSLFWGGFITEGKQRMHRSRCKSKSGLTNRFPDSSVSNYTLILINLSASVFRTTIGEFNKKCFSYSRGKLK